MSKLFPWRSKRRTYVLDAAWQLHVFRRIAAVALVAGVFQLLVTSYVSNQDPLDRWSGQQIGLLALATNALFMALVFGALWFVSVRVTHSVVGPAFILKRAVDGLLRGDFEQRVSLREHDYLKDLAGSVSELREHMAAQDSARGELEDALTRGDQETALRIARSLRQPRAADPAEEARECAA